MKLAKTYYEVISNNNVIELSKQFLSLALCRGFQALSFALLSVIEIYQELPNNFWPLCYRLYSESEVFTVVNSKVKIEDDIFSVSLFLKQILILCAIDTNRLTSNEVEEIAKYSMKIAHYMDLKQAIEEETLIGFGFYFEQDIPPKKLDLKKTVASKTLRYISIHYIVKVIEFILYEALENKNKDFVNIKLLENIIYILLDKTQNHFNTKINKRYNCYSLIGIHSIIDFLLEKEGKEETERHRAEKYGVNKEESLEEVIDGLQLMVDWEEDSVSTQTQQRNFIEGLQIIGSSIEGYQIFGNKESAVQLKMGQAIGVIPEFSSSRNRVEVGIIRRISITNEGIIFNVELLGLESTLIQVEKINTFEACEWEIFLFGSPRYEISILCTQEHEYNIGEDISVLLSEKKIRCKLGKVLNATALVNHISLHYL